MSIIFNSDRFVCTSHGVDDELDKKNQTCMRKQGSYACVFVCVYVRVCVDVIFVICDLCVCVHARLFAIVCVSMCVFYGLFVCVCVCVYLLA